MAPAQTRACWPSGAAGPNWLQSRDIDLNAVDLNTAFFALRVRCQRGRAAANADGNVEGLAALIFTRYLWAFELTSALRYDATQRALFLEQPRIEDFHASGGGKGLDEASRSLLNAWLVDYARREPVYRIDPALAAMLGSLDVASAGVADGHLVLTFNQDIAAMAGALAPAD